MKRKSSKLRNNRERFTLNAKTQEKRLKSKIKYIIKKRREAWKATKSPL